MPKITILETFRKKDLQIEHLSLFQIVKRQVIVELQS